MIIRSDTEIMKNYLDWPPGAPGCNSIFIIKLRPQNGVSVCVNNSYNDFYHLPEHGIIFTK